MLRSRKACWMADRSIYKRLFYTTAGVAGFLEGGLEDVLVLEWVENPHIKLPKISFIPGRNNQTMDPCGSGNHSVL
jgi:hypothetical protein